MLILVYLCLSELHGPEEWAESLNQVLSQGHQNEDYEKKMKHFYMFHVTDN